MAFHPFQDLGLKGLAVGLAVLLWLSVSAQPIVERGIQVPLELENVPAGLAIAGDLPGSVQVRVRGTSASVDGLQVGDVVAVLDLADERPGRRLFDLFADRIETPPGVEVTSVVPSAIALTLEPTGTSRTVSIVPALEGEPADGYTVGLVTTDPPTVDVIGPETSLHELREALTEPISLDGAIGRLESVVTVGVSDPTLRLATPLSARVTVEIVPAPLERTLHDVPVVARAASTSATFVVEPDRITVGVRGPRGLVQGLAPASVVAYVDLDGLPRGQYNRPVTIEATGELGITHIDPPVVHITVR